MSINRKVLLCIAAAVVTTMLLSHKQLWTAWVGNAAGRPDAA